MSRTAGDRPAGTQGESSMARHRNAEVTTQDTPDHDHRPGRAATGQDGHMDHQGHEAHGQGGRSKHAGHHVDMFRRRFWWSLLLTIPLVVTSDMIMEWFGYSLDFPGMSWVGPVLGTFVF